MQRSVPSVRHLVWLVAVVALPAGCDTPANPAGPSALPVAGGMDQSVVSGGAQALAPSASRGRRPAKVRLCHQRGNGSYVPIDVAEPAVPAHLRHGDMAPDGAHFDAACVPRDPEPDPTPVPDVTTLSCGAPPQATNPGSTVPPGPDVDASAGRFFEFAVAASPIPPAGTWILREVIDAYATGIQTSAALVPLGLDGTYAGTRYTAASLPFQREIRFTYGEAACSLYWNVNPV